MLIDPPAYVAIPPGLIYHCDDLERENYRALLQVIGWMWVTKRHGRPLTTSTAELAEKWQLEIRAVQTRLRVLADRGYLTITYRGGRADISLGPRCNSPTASDYAMPTDNNMLTPAVKRSGAPAEGPATGVDNNTPGEPAHNNTPPAPAPPAPRKQLARPGANSLRPPTNNTVVDDLLHFDRVIDQQQQTNAALLDAGVFPDIAAELAADPWITPERVCRWRDALEDDPHIRNPAAVLSANLRARRPPPPTEAELDERRRHRYIEGPYADLIEH